MFKPNDFPCPLPEGLSEKEALSSLVNSVETKDPKLIGHGARTAWYSLQVGQAIPLPDQDLEHLMYAAYLHDVGKLTIPQHILLKEEPLSSQEFHQLQSHPRAAMTLLESWPFLKIPSIWIAHHHERWDGSGYPNGLKGAYIPLGSRIIAIADTYDVLTLRNLGQGEADLEACLSILRWYAGSHFDPELIDTFSHLLLEGVRSKEGNGGECSLSSAQFHFQESHLHDSSSMRHSPAVHSVGEQT